MVHFTWSSNSACKKSNVRMYRYITVGKRECSQSTFKYLQNETDYTSRLSLCVFLQEFFSGDSGLNNIS